MLSLTNFFVVLIAAGFAIFMNYPSPPESPIVYQWRTLGGNHYQHEQFQIFYKDELGNGSLGVVLCLHGFPTSSFDWYKVWPTLKRQFNRVITIDFLGLGFSDKPRHHDYTIKEQADIIVAILKFLNIEGVNILAHDYGDTVALELLARRLAVPAIHSACLLNGGLFPGFYYPRWSQRALRTPIIGTILSRFINYLTFKSVMTELFATNRPPTYEDLRDMWYIVRVQDGYRVFQGLLSYIDERSAYEDRWVGALRETKVPVHMIYGVEDPVNPPPFAQHYKDVVPSPSIQELEDVGHYVQLEAPDEMLNSYLTFLSTISAKQK